MAAETVTPRLELMWCDTHGRLPYQCPVPRRDICKTWLIQWCERGSERAECAEDLDAVLNQEPMEMAIIESALRGLVVKWRGEEGR